MKEDRPVEITYEDPWYVIKDVLTGVASQGETEESARRNLKEALELYEQPI